MVERDLDPCITQMGWQWGIGVGMWYETGGQAVVSSSVDQCCVQHIRKNTLIDPMLM